MSRQVRHRVLIALLAVLLSVACEAAVPEPTAETGWRCTPLPESFTEADLVGTWLNTGEAGTATDELILRADGTYKQMYQKSKGYRYESSWQRWWVEHKPGGGIYLHLEGMRYCHLTDEVCAMPEGGGGDWWFHDVCEGRLLEMRDEVILAVVGTKGTRHPSIIGAPRGIALMHMLPSSDTTSSFFVLKEE
jgi:hypothetical protein